DTKRYTTEIDATGRAGHDTQVALQDVVDTEVKRLVRQIQHATCGTLGAQTACEVASLHGGAEAYHSVGDLVSQRVQFTAHIRMAVRCNRCTTKGCGCKTPGNCRPGDIRHAAGAWIDTRWIGTGPDGRAGDRIGTLPRIPPIPCRSRQKVKVGGRQR